jgi:hypothetical protein
LLRCSILEIDLQIQVSIKISGSFFGETDKLISKTHKELQGIQNIQKYILKKEKFGGLTVPNFKTLEGHGTGKGQPRKSVEETVWK